METFDCSRCGYESPRKENFLRHLRRKYPCRPKLQDVPTEEIFHNYFEYKYTLENIPNPHKPTQSHTKPHKHTQKHTKSDKDTQIHKVLPDRV